MARNAHYSEYVKRVCALIGIPSQNLSDDEWSILNGFFNKAYRLVSETYQWPELTIREERTPDSNYLIPYEEVGYTTISEVFDVWANTPNTSTLPTRVGYELTPDGIQILSFTSNEAPGNFWVSYRAQVPTFDGDDYDPNLPNFIGDRIYYTSTITGKGNYYDVIEDTSAGENPDNAPSKFEVLVVSWTFFEAVVHAAYADWLRADGQADKAAQADIQAAEIMGIELDKAERQQGYTTRTVYQTHLTSRPAITTFSSASGSGGGSSTGAYLRVNQNLADVEDAENSRESLGVDFSLGSATVNSSGNTALTLQTGEHERTYNITAQTGSGSYTAVLYLLTNNAHTGDAIRIAVDMAASTNPTLEFRSAAFNGTLLLSVSGDGSGTGFHATFTFNGTGWIKTEADFDE